MTNGLDSSDMARLVAQFDQFGGMLEAMAETLSSYYKALVDKGVPEGTAHVLVVQLQQKIMPQNTSDLQ